MIKKFIFLVSLVYAHMEMSYPRIPNSRYDNLPDHQKDYRNIFPIGSRHGKELPFCHRDMSNLPALDTFREGATFTARFKGDAPHDGGHCEFALSYDGKHFAVIKTIIADCLAHGVRQYDVEIPKGAPAGKAILAWTWVNRIGERELYMNCAKINIKGPTTGSVTGPTQLIANLPGYPTISQFRYSVKGVHLYRNRPSTVTGIDSRRKPFYKIKSNKGAKKLPGRHYFYDPYHPNLDPTKGFPDTGKDENLDD